MLPAHQSKRNIYTSINIYSLLTPRFSATLLRMNHNLNPPDGQTLDKLKAIVGTGGWALGSQPTRHFDDPRGRFTGKACLILLPSSTEQVAEIVLQCNSSKVGIVPISGGSGVVAGQLSIDSDHVIVLSLEKMNKVRDISVDDGVVVAEAGCILENIHNTAYQHGLMFPLSMASKGSCCIGGNLATNAGGIQVLRHGNARDLCLGIEAVLPNGTVYSELSPLRKNNTGYDLRNLLIGSEGTLGIITAATLIVKPIDPETVTALCAVESPAQALMVFKQLRIAMGDNISALELMSKFGLELVTKHFPSLQLPFSLNHSWFLLVEVAGQEGIGSRFEEALANCLDQELIADATMAQSQTQQTNLWDLRENTPEANRIGGAFCSSDTAVPISKVDAFIEHTTNAIVDIHAGLQINTYGHIGDGNIHHNVLPPTGHSKAAFINENPGIVELVRMAINDATVKFDGSISAEHGIGRLKVRDLELYAGGTKLAAIRSIKGALDPNGIMNPGAVID